MMNFKGLIALQLLLLLISSQSILGDQVYVSSTPTPTPQPTTTPTPTVTTDSNHVHTEDNAAGDSDGKVGKITHTWTQDDKPHQTETSTDHDGNIHQVHIYVDSNKNTHKFEQWSDAKGNVHQCHIWVDSDKTTHESVHVTDKDGNVTTEHFIQDKEGKIKKVSGNTSSSSASSNQTEVPAGSAILSQSEVKSGNLKVHK